MCVISGVNSLRPMIHSPPGSSAHGIFQTRILSGLPFLPPGDLPDPGIEPVSLISPALAGRLFTTSTTWEDSGGHEDPVKTLVPNAAEQFYLML